MRRRYVEVDVLKVAGIAAVILIHCMRPPWDMWVSPTEVWIGHLTRFGVPAFLMASGFLYAKERPTSEPAKPMIRRLRRITLPYFAVSLTAQAWWFIQGASTETGSLWLDLALGASMGPFYYVFVITGLVAATPLLMRVQRGILAMFTIAMIAAQGWADAALGFRVELFWHLRNPLVWWAYFLVGWQYRCHRAAVVSWIASRDRWLAASLWVAISVLATVIALGESDIPPWGVRTAAWLNIYAIIALIVACTCTKTSSPPILRFLSDATFAIYLLHLFFVTTAQQYIPAPPLRAELLPILIPWLAGTFGSIATITAFQKLLGMRSRYLIGV